MRVASQLPSHQEIVRADPGRVPVAIGSVPTVRPVVVGAVGVVVFRAGSRVEVVVAVHDQVGLGWTGNLTLEPQVAPIVGPGGNEALGFLGFD